MGGFDSVGSLLADIANLIVEAMRILGSADKMHWGQDEHELLQALDRTLDDAKRDFQELSPLVKGQSHYENDRSFDSIKELQTLRSKFQAHVQHVRDWSHSGGAVDGTWVRETQSLQVDLHRAQCRAARRVFTSAQESSQRRCLGAFIVDRRQRANRRKVDGTESDFHRRQLEEAMICSAVGSFERFGEQDIAFICDFCDGHIIWEDLERVPTTRAAWDGIGTPPITETAMPSSEWQAMGVSQSNQQMKQVVFAPMAVANHAAPLRGDWQARLLCSLCEDEARQPQDEDDEEDLDKPDDEFDDLAALQEHLEWQHVPMSVMVTAPESSSSCVVM